MERSLGLYIHIPFCIKKCNYCDFCSFPNGSGVSMEAYVSELCRRISGASPLADCHKVDTVYFGGGTPTLLPLPLFEKILLTLQKNYHISSNVEISCECNPASTDADHLSGLRRLGIDRLSIGLQSSSDRELTLLGRAHSYSDFLKTYDEARRAGFENVSVDLMYGLPDQTEGDLERTVKDVISCRPEHISSYCLKIEEGTPFFDRAHELSLPDEDSQLSMYLLCGDLLRSAGYDKYEISNFALKGYESKHNLKYWLGGEYLGFGVAAYSHFGGERFGNSRDITRFIQGEDIECERVKLSPTEIKDEYVMLRLRLTSGIDLEEYRSLFGEDILSSRPMISTYVSSGFMKLEGSRLSFTDRGFFISNYILSELLDLE